MHSFSARLSATLVAMSFLIAQPVWAVYGQRVDFPNAEAVEGVTLTLDTGQVLQGEVEEDDDGDKFVIFELEDSTRGATGTVTATVDGREQTRSIQLGSVAAILSSGIAASTQPSRGGFFVGAAASVAGFSNDSAVSLATTSEQEGVALFTDSGLVNIGSSSSAEDSDTLFGVGILAGYEFPNGNQVFLETTKFSTAEMPLSTDITGAIPMTPFTATGQSTGLVEVDLWITSLNFSGYFGSSDFGYVLTVANADIDREANFTTNLVVGPTIQSISGGDSLDDNQVSYGAALQWAPRTESNRSPFIRVGFLNTGDSDALGDDSAEVFYLSGGIRLSWK